jgi:hypothetical protein
LSVLETSPLDPGIEEIKQYASGVGLIASDDILTLTSY